MENPRVQLLERLQSANNILITVSSNPTVDQLSAAIGLTLMLNKLDKQATAVFSGKVPSTIEFLEPEKTIEQNTNSLRDFIIALDKSKADKLRYKVEDNHVKIFITPYKTALSESDLKFSQGDFNIEVVIALGVKEQTDLDRAITAHGRILHDATTISMTNGDISSLGSIDWDDPKASGLSEMAASLASDLGQASLDGQIATAFLTGIVAQTERFRNDRTQPATMSIASALMAAGANQQLIADKLEHAVNIQNPSSESADKDDQKTGQSDQPTHAAKSDPSALRITHEESAPEPEPPVDDVQSEPPKEQSDEPHEALPGSGLASRGLVLEPPTLGSRLTANTEPEHLDEAIDPLGVKDVPQPLLSRKETPAEEPAIVEELPEPQVEETEVPAEPAPEAAPEAPVEAPAPQSNTGYQTLQDLEAAVHASYDQPDDNQPTAEAETPQVPDQPAPSAEPTGDISSARDAVSDALASISSSQPLPPIAALGAQPFDINDQLGDQPPQQQDEYFKLPDEAEIDHSAGPVAPAQDFTMPENLVPPAGPTVDATAAPADPLAPPAVPPPFMPNMPGFDASLPPIPPQPGQDTQQPPATPGNPFNLPPA